MASLMCGRLFLRQPGPCQAFANYWRTQWNPLTAAWMITRSYVRKETTASDILSKRKHRSMRMCTSSSEIPPNQKSYSFLPSAAVALAMALSTLYFARKKDDSREPVNRIVWLSVAKCANDSRTKYNFLAKTVQEAAPAVVFIETQQRIKTLWHNETILAASSASGFIVDKSGYVITNAHVIRRAQRVTVKLWNGRKLAATVVDTDLVADLALLKIEGLQNGENLPALPLGDSHELQPGEWVVALGSPLALANTITAGIVSSAHRPGTEMEQLGLKNTDMEYIQTDAAITRGNSGGPLVNLDAEVIGVNTMTAGPGISFAIPSHRVKEFLERKRPRVQQYALAVSMMTVTPSVRAHLGISIPHDASGGVLLARVWPGGAADLAGLRPGDVIIRINKANISSSKDVQEFVQKGRPLEMEIMRERSNRKLVVVYPDPL